MTFRSLPVLSIVALGVLLGGCRTLQVDPSPPAPDAWTTEGGAPDRRAAAAPLALPLEADWAYDANAGFGPGSALVTGETVLVATRKGEVHAIDLATGRRLGMKGFGDAIEGTPVLRDGTLFVPVAWGRRALAAYDLSRAETRWTHDHAPVEAGLLMLDDRLVAVDVEGVVRAYDPATGDTLWRYGLGDARTAVGAPVALGDRFLVADDRGTVTALTPEGRRLWSAELGAPVGATGAAQGDRAYLPTTRGALVALDTATGAERWRYEAGDVTVYLAAPAVDGGRVAVGGSDGVVRALDAATGAVVWTRDLGESIVGAPVLTPSHVFVGTTGELVVALDRTTGEVRWEEEVEGRVRSALAASGDRLVVLTDDRNVYLFTPSGSPYASTR